MIKVCLYCFVILSVGEKKMRRKINGMKKSEKNDTANN